MKKILFSALLASITFNVYAADNDAQIDRTQEVFYTCKVQVNGKLQDQKISAMYGIKGDDVIVAQLKINGKITPGMWRDDFVIMNRFISQDPNQKTTVWTTLPTNAQNLANTDGGTFSVAETSGAQQSIVFNKCKVVKK